MKVLIVVGDGMADEPVEALGGRTPMEASRTPYMDDLAARGTMGLVQTVPEGFPPGSDVANLSLMGYAPVEYYTGRAPLEAASMGIAMDPDDVAFRCNLVSLRERGRDRVMEDYSGGGIATERAAGLIERLNERLANQEYRFHAGVSYRHLFLWKGARQRVEGLETTPPHDITGRTISGYLPRGPGSEELIDLMEQARGLLEPLSGSDCKANAIWLWGQGRAPRMPTLTERFGIRGVTVSAVDLIKGLGKCAGLEAVDVPGATGELETNYQGKVFAVLKALERCDFAFLHVEAPDEAGHRGDPLEKVEAIERFDEQVVGPLLKGLERRGEPFRLALLPDHPTPVRIRTHTADPVPFVLFPGPPEWDPFSSPKTGPSRPSSFTERDARRTGIRIEEGSRLIEILTR